MIGTALHYSQFQFKTIDRKHKSMLSATFVVSVLSVASQLEQPWTNKKLAPKARAAAMVKNMVRESVNFEAICC